MSTKHSGLGGPCCHLYQNLQDMQCIFTRGVVYFPLLSRALTCYNNTEWNFDIEARPWACKMHTSHCWPHARSTWSMHVVQLCNAWIYSDYRQGFAQFFFNLILQWVSAEIVLYVQKTQAEKTTSSSSLLICSPQISFLFNLISYDVIIYKHHFVHVNFEIPGYQFA